MVINRITLKTRESVSYISVALTESLYLLFGLSVGKLMELISRAMLCCRINAFLKTFCHRKQFLTSVGIHRNDIQILMAQCYLPLLLHALITIAKVTVYSTVCQFFTTHLRLRSHLAPSISIHYSINIQLAASVSVVCKLFFINSRPSDCFFLVSVLFFNFFFFCSFTFLWFIVVFVFFRLAVDALSHCRLFLLLTADTWCVTLSLSAVDCDAFLTLASCCASLRFNQSINQSIYFVTHKHYSQNNVIKQNIHIMCDG